MLKVGIIGTGTVAREHAQAVKQTDGQVTIVAAADVSGERLVSFCNDLSIEKRYADAATLIKDPNVDLVTIATPPSSHEEAAVAALDAGKYVLCEKPLAHSLASAERIATAAASYPGRLSVSYQLRYAPQYRRMLWLVNNGWIGEVEECVVQRHSYIPHAVVGNGNWWGAWEIAGGGVLMTQTIHELDIMLQAMGEPRSVTAEMDTRYTAIESEDWIAAQVYFDGKRVARCSASVNSGHIRSGLTFTGRFGSVSPGKLVLSDPSQHDKAIQTLNAALPDTKPMSMSLPGRTLGKVAGKLGLSHGSEPSAHARLYCDIADSIARAAPLPLSSSEALKSLHLCVGIYQAAITGKEVELPLRSNASAYGGITKSSYDARKRAVQAPIIVVPRLPKSNTVRIGLIGLDTSHGPTFADLLHNPYNSDHIPGARIAAAFPGGSPDMPISASRVGQFTAELKDKYRVPILDTPEAVADAADVVFILSADGRNHPGLFRSVAGRGKPVFIDKPLAISKAEAELIFAIAHKTGTKLFATSAYRYADALVSALNAIRGSGERIIKCTICYPGLIQPTQGRFFWYGIHGAEMLLAVMGKGIVAVEAKTVGVEDVIEVEHKDGRRSSLIGHHNDVTFRAAIETDKRKLNIEIGGAISARVLTAALDVLRPDYPRLWRASDAGSVSGRPGKSLDPDEAETLEVIALLDAAQQSHAIGRKKDL